MPGGASPLVLSVIVPLAPGEREWPELLRQLMVLPVGCEVIVVASDGAACPAPAGWPATVPYRAVQSAPGRARQQNLGARLADGHWLWFVHADTRLRPHSLSALARFIASGVEGLGWFRLAFRNDGPRATAINAFGANLRARWLGLPFGDQGLTLPRRLFQNLGGFDESVLHGEDHWLVWAVRRAGLPLKPIPATLETSARKYAQHGWLHTTWRHVRLTVIQAWSAWRCPARLPR